ncbi:MAG TPA: PqiC family protein [Polyangiaceae bacterium]|jgi:hypothetical protein|nr:PqiC family protein [Polyangiaceae bacterium]
MKRLLSPLERIARVVWAAIAITLAGGCGSSPPSSFFALSPTSPAAAGSAQPGALHTVRIRRPALPGYLDRPEVVHRIAGYRLGVAANDRWGGPLDEMVGRVLAQDLEVRVPGVSAYTEDGAISAEADATVEVNIERFEADERGEMWLAADVAVERGLAHQGATRSVHLTSHSHGETTAAIVAAMSDLLGQLSDQIAGMLASP